MMMTTEVVTGSLMAEMGNSNTSPAKTKALARYVVNLPDVFLSCVGIHEHLRHHLPCDD